MQYKVDTPWFITSKRGLIEDRNENCKDSACVQFKRHIADICIAYVLMSQQYIDF